MRKGTEQGTYYLSGEISSNTYRSLIEVLNKNKGSTIYVLANSNGGWIAGIDEAMDAIRQHGQVNWEVSEHNICYSACALLGIAAKRINGTLQFHSLSASYKDSRYIMAGKNEELVEKIISYGYERELAEKLLNSVNIFTKVTFKDGKPQ